MTTLNRSADVAAEIVARVSDIKIVNGYQTDIGTLVFQGRRNISDNQLPCAVLIEGTDDVTDQSARNVVRLKQHYVVGGYVECDPDNPNVAAHRVLRDIKKALFKDGDRWGGKVQKVTYDGRDIGPRADGEPIVFAVVHFSVEYAETLTDA